MSCNLKSTTLYAILVYLALSVSFAAAGPTDSVIAMRLEPSQVDVSLFYDGADVEVEAVIPDCDGVALLLAADGDDVTLNRKGREAGIWLNVAQVTIQGAPSIYMLAVSAPLGSVCPRELQEELQLGLESVRDAITATCEQPLIGTEIDEFLKLKRESGAYITDIAITLTPGSGGNQNLSAVLPIAATVPPGHYRVRLFCFEDGEIIQQADSDLYIRVVGLVSIMTKLAHDHAAAYGLLAIVVAMTVGIVMGIVFHSLPGSGH